MTTTLLLPADRNLILTGYTGLNQLVIGQRVAERLRVKFVDVERQLEQRADMPLEALRAQYGETQLKKLEAEVMQDVLLYRGSVIRIGGQTLLNADYAARLQITGPIVCLVVALDAALRRLHMQMGARYHNPHQRALAVGQLQREWDARRLPGIHEVDATYMTDADIVEAVVRHWQPLATIA